MRAEAGVGIAGPFVGREQGERTLLAGRAGGEAALDEVGHDFAPARAGRAEDEVDERFSRAHFSSRNGRQGRRNCESALIFTPVANLA